MSEEPTENKTDETGPIDRVAWVSMDSLDLGHYQVRTTNVGEGIDELAASIDDLGLLHPIVVCTSPRDSDRWEIVCGQRRYLAHKKLGKSEIHAGIFDRVLTKLEGKKVSANENIHQVAMSRPDLIDMCEELYEVYGTLKAVVEKTNIPYHEVRKYVRLARLEPDLQEERSNGRVNLDWALKIQDACTVEGKFDAEQAKEMVDVIVRTDDELRKEVIRQKTENPYMSIDQAEEAAEAQPEKLKITGTLTGSYCNGLRTLAGEKGGTTNQVGISLIENSLVSLGYVPKE